MEENSNEQISVVLGETEIVDCDADIEGISEEDNVHYQICNFNRDDNGTAYRVVHINDSQVDSCEPHTVSPTLNAVQVLTSPISGQFYVLSNESHVLASDTSESFATSNIKLQSDKSNNVSFGAKKRDERRRVTHNEVERRRRDKINNWISKLGKLLPESDQTSGEGEGKTNLESQSKGDILARACQYITELREVHENYAQSLDENVQLLEEVKSLRQIVNELRNENTQLKAQVPSDSSYILGS